MHVFNETKITQKLKLEEYKVGHKEFTLIKLFSMT